MSLRWTFNPNIARASTAPARLYTDPVFLELEQERIFGRMWQLAARTEQLAEEGNYVATEIGGERIVIVRGPDGLRGFHNICLHRAGPVAEGCGKRKTLQCRYHGWTYSLGGELIRAPEMEGTEGFVPAEMHLLPVQVEALGPLVFANLDPKAPPLADFVGDIPSRLAALRADRMRYVMRKEWEIACNWKVYVDNYLEGYHLPMVHPGLYKELDYDAYRVETHRYHSRQHAPVRAAKAGDVGRKYVADADGGAGVDGRAGSDPAVGDSAEYYWLFPNVMLNIYLGQMQTNVVLPMGHDRTKVVFEWFAESPPADAGADPEWTKLVGFSDEIQAEDIEICEAVQVNLRSRVYDRGRYSAARENGVHHFHSLLHESIG